MRVAWVALVVGALSGCGQEDAHAPPKAIVDPVRRPPATAATVAAFLATWATPDGAEIDSATGYPTRVRRSKDRGVMVLIPAGTFQLGAVPGDSDAFDTERPRHAVTLSRAYYLDESEVTNDQFEEFVSATGHKTTAEVVGDGVMADDDGNAKETTGATWRSPRPGGKRPSDGARLPVVLVSWNDAAAFADWAGVALPTEAQFERASRGGHEGRVFPWGNELPAPNGSGNFADASATRRFKGWARTMQGYDDGFDRTAPVRSFAPNEFGIHDLSGNVWEWCADWFEAAYYATSPAKDPTGPESGTERVLRGGAWSFDPRGLRVSDRAPGAPTLRDDNGGFRCAKSTP
jgi:formylglycine-generating enzyme required for sulfatase activity